MCVYVCVCVCQREREREGGREREREKRERESESACVRERDVEKKRERVRERSSPRCSSSSHAAPFFTGVCVCLSLPPSVRECVRERHQLLAAPIPYTSPQFP